MNVRISKIMASILNNGKYTYVMTIFTQVPANVFAADTYICNKY